MVERASVLGHDARVRTMTKIDYGEPANKPDAANPAMALWFAIADQWRRVADLERSKQAR